MANAGKTITQRIALDGGADIKAQLNDIGTAGQAAFKKLQDGVAAAATLERIGPVLDAIKARAEAVGAAAENFGKKFESFEGSVERSVKAIALMGGAAIGAVAGFVELIKSSADSQQQLEKTAEAVGTTAQQLEALQFAAASQGIGEDQFTRGLTKLNATLGTNQKQLLETKKKQNDLTNEFINGKISADDMNTKFGDLNRELAQNVTVFNRLGIATTNADGTLRDTTAVLKDIADEFQKMPDGAEKSAIAIQLFGTRNAQMVSLLNKGSEGIAKLTEEAERVAPALSPIQVAINQKLAIAFDTLGRAMTSVKNAFATLFAPAFTDLIQAITEAIVRNRGAILDLGDALEAKLRPIIDDIIALLNNSDGQATGLFEKARAQIVSFADDARHAVTDILIPAFKGLYDILKVVAEALNGLFGTKLTGGQLAFAAILLRMVGAFGLIRTAVQLVIAGIGFLVATFGAVPAVIGLIVVALGVLIFKALGGVDGIKDKWNTAWTAIHDFVTGIFDKLTAAGQAVVDALSSGWSKTVDAVKSAASQISDFFSSTWASIKQTASDLVDNVVKQVGDMRDAIVQTFNDVVAKVTDFFNNLPANLKAAFDALVKLASDTWDSIVAKAKEIVTGIVDSFKSGLDSIAGFFRSLVDDAILLLQSIVDKATEVANAVAGALGLASGGGGNSGSAPGFASGGMVRGPGTSRSDSIWARLSNGEFVNNARSVDYYGTDFFSALNARLIPKNLVAQFASLGAALGNFSPDLSSLLPGVPRFADGGPVGVPAFAGGSGRPLVLNLGGGHVIHAVAPADELAALERAATGKQIRSAGRKPSWFLG